MKYKKIYIGSWTLGSTIHLKELYQAMAFYKSPNFKAQQIKSLMRGIKPVSIEYLPQAINMICGEFQNHIYFDILEDGLIVLSKDIKDLKNDYKEVDKIMDNEVKPFRRSILSKDIASPKAFEEVKTKNPVLIHVDNAKEKDLENIFKEFEVIPYKKIKLKKGGVWIGESMVVLYNVNIKDKALQEAVHYLIFARLYEMKLKKLLDIQRILWNKIEGIRSKRYYKSKELPGVRDEAVSIQNHANFFKNRSKQMSQFLSLREKYIDDYLSDHVLTTIFKEFFETIKSTQQYLYELLVMTDNYADSTVQSVSLLYSDINQRELSTLQKLFLISAIISVLSLGTLAGSSRVTFDKSGELISRSLASSWSMASFVYYGLVVLFFLLIIYFLFYFVFSRLGRERKISAKGKEALKEQ